MSSSHTNNAAVISVVFGGLSWFALPLLGAVVAVIAGHMARAQIRRTGEDGDGLAVAGMMLGYANLLLSCVSTILAFAIFGTALLTMLGIAAAQ